MGWDGFLRQMLDKIDFRRAIELQEDLPRPGSILGYDPGYNHRRFYRQYLVWG